MFDEHDHHTEFQYGWIDELSCCIYFQNKAVIVQDLEHICDDDVWENLLKGII